MQINSERLAGFFTELCTIESPSRKEGRVAQYLQDKFSDLQANSITMDDSSRATGSETNNLFIRFDGDETAGDAVFFACHMDTVGPTDGIEVVRNGDVFTSRGNTVLGADDKSGIAAVLELATLLRENSVRHCPIEFVFTTCEEIGLRGAKAMDISRISALYGYALDSTSKGRIITGAPAANRIKVRINGKAAHSGLAPESGVNALSIAAHAITQTTLGRIDNLSTANFGLIAGGSAINIVPEQIDIEGEVRSHSTAMLNSHTEEIKRIFHRVAENWPLPADTAPPVVSIDVQEEFPVMNLQDGEPVLKRIERAAHAIGFPFSFDIAGGGSDANIFCGEGLPTAIIPTGMSSVHSTDEYVELADMVELTRLLLAMVTDRSQETG